MCLPLPLVVRLYASLMTLPYIYKLETLSNNKRLLFFFSLSLIIFSANHFVFVPTAFNRHRAHTFLFLITFTRVNIFRLYLVGDGHF